MPDEGKSPFVSWPRPDPAAPAPPLHVVAFLRARLDELEIHAQIAGPGEVAWATFLRADGTLAYTSVVSRNGDKWVTNGQVVEPIGTTVIFDQAIMLADVAAKRRLLTMYEASASAAVDDPNDDEQVHCARGLGYAVELLALPHAGHPDYQEGWRP